MNIAKETKPSVTRRFTRYVFLDVVGFSYNRSAEAQSDIIGVLNRAVRDSLSECGVVDETRILLPTGDGMCIALHDLQFDLHIQLALSVLRRLDEYNSSTKDETRKFLVRIGINQNTDVFFADINERPNLAGAGINLASRIMDTADGNQILVGHTVYDELQPSEEYMNKFEAFETTDKHGFSFRVYQYVGKGHVGLNCTTPVRFAKEQITEPKLSKVHAYYFANAIRLKDFIVKNQGHGQNNYSLMVMLWFLAKDELGASEATDISPYRPSIYGEGTASLDELFAHYESVDFDVIAALAMFIVPQLLKYDGCLISGVGVMPLFVTNKGEEKLKSEWPSIYEEMRDAAGNAT